MPAASGFFFPLSIARDSIAAYSLLCDPIAYLDPSGLPPQGDASIAPFKHVHAAPEKMWHNPPVLSRITPRGSEAAESAIEQLSYREA